MSRNRLKSSVITNRQKNRIEDEVAGTSGLNLHENDEFVVNEDVGDGKGSQEDDIGKLRTHR